MVLRGSRLCHVVMLSGKRRTGSYMRLDFTLHRATVFIAKVVVQLVRACRVFMSALLGILRVIAMRGRKLNWSPCVRGFECMLCLRAATGRVLVVIWMHMIGDSGWKALALCSLILKGLRSCVMVRRRLTIGLRLVSVAGGSSAMRVRTARVRGLLKRLCYVLSLLVQGVGTVTVIFTPRPTVCGIEDLRSCMLSEELAALFGEFR